VYDFLSRFPSRDVGPIPTVLYVTLFGLVPLSIFVVAGGGELGIVWPKLWLVAVAGIFFTLATLALFAAFARGPMTVVAPIVAAYPGLAMNFAEVQGARPSAWQWLAILCVLAGVVVCAQSGSQHEDQNMLAKGKMSTVIGLALLSGVCFAIAITAGQVAAPIFGEIATVWLARIFGLLTIGLIYLVSSPGAPLPKNWLPLLALMGCLDITALGALTAAGNLPSPEFATVISSAFGVITVILARIFLKEKISRLQLCGMVMVFGGVAALSAL
jgi:drug/metabolite transporter (DMT)-like permease